MSQHQNWTGVHQCGCSQECQKIVLAVVGSSLVWLNLYYIVSAINQKHSAEWNCRIIAGLHGTVSAICCFISVFILGPWPFSYIGYPPNSFHCIIIIISSGYFLFDLLWCLYMKTEGILMLSHHTLSIFGLTYTMYFNLYGCESISVLGASEFTNPLLQLRWFLKQTGNYSGKTALLIDWSFSFFFICARVVVGGILYFCLMMSQRMDKVAKIGGTMMYVIVIIFSINLVMFIHRKYVKQTPYKDD